MRSLTKRKRLCAVNDTFLYNENENDNENKQERTKRQRNEMRILKRSHAINLCNPPQSAELFVGRL